MQDGMNIQIQQLVELAKETETIDSDIWNYMHISREQAYYLMASQVLEMTKNMKNNEVLPILMASMTHLLVENFILNLYIEGGLKGDKKDKK